MPLWKNADGILIANSSGILINCAQCPCDPPAAPCTCPSEGLLDIYAISASINYECSSPSSSLPELITITDPTVSTTGPCSWTGTAGSETDVEQCNGVSLSPYSCSIQLTTGGSDGMCYWIAYIQMRLRVADTYLYNFSFRKNTGLTPIGSYTFYSGSESGPVSNSGRRPVSTATLTVS